MQKPRIAYVSESSPSDRHAWSGTVHYVYEALVRSGFSVSPAGPARPRFIRYLLASLNKLSLTLSGRRFDYRHSRIYARAFGAIFTKRLKHIEHDLVVVCGNTECGAYIVTDKPVVYVLDRTIQGAINYHAILSDLWSFSLRESILTDKRAMQQAARLFFSSVWAANHARLYYGIAPEKISIIPFGANLDEFPSREQALLPRKMDVCKLLLIGTSWKNKGADIAANALKRLTELNINARLTVVGCEPPVNPDPQRITIIPFADKNTAEGRTLLTGLYLSHHFFILPTRFDCTPIVFCEASAFGLPVITADTGGVAGHVTGGVNGFLIPYTDSGEAYAKKIAEIFNDANTYRSLCASTRQQFETKLNWEAWANEFGKNLPLTT